MNKILFQYHKCAIGELIIASWDEQLCLLDYRYRTMRSVVDKRIAKGLAAEMVEGICETNQRAISQLDQYLAGRRQSFDIAIKTIGTEFQQSVWQALQQIPFGETRSYAEVAAMIGEPKAVRAVASANGANALAVIIPCHRVIGSDGSLTGYAGGLSAKKKLLGLEQTDLFSAA